MIDEKELKQQIEDTHIDIEDILNIFKEQPTYLKLVTTLFLQQIEGIKSNQVIQFDKLTETRLNDIFERISDNNDIFKKYIKSNLDFQLMTVLRPAYANRLIEKVLNNADIFKIVIDGHGAIIDVIMEYPGCINSLIKGLLNDDDVFMKAINISNLTYLAKKYPICANQLIEKILNDSNKIIHIIKNDIGLKYTAPAFPDYAYILGKPTLKEVLDHITNIKESKENIKNAVMTFAQGRRTGHDLFKWLPDELIVEIAANSGTNNYVQKEKAKEMSICYPFWNKPIGKATFSQELLDIVPPSLD